MELGIRVWNRAGLEGSLVLRLPIGTGRKTWRDEGQHPNQIGRRGQSIWEASLAEGSGSFYERGRCRRFVRTTPRGHCLALRLQGFGNQGYGLTCGSRGWGFVHRSPVAEFWGLVDWEVIWETPGDGLPTTHCIYYQP